MSKTPDAPGAAPGHAGEAAPVVWWRLPILWLVIGGPLVVVVAALGTAVIAWHGADEVLDTQAGAPGRTTPADEPAIRARNHAATPR